MRPQESFQARPQESLPAKANRTDLEIDVASPVASPAESPEVISRRQLFWRNITDTSKQNLMAVKENLKAATVMEAMKLFANSVRNAFCSEAEGGKGTIMIRKMASVKGNK